MKRGCVAACAVGLVASATAAHAQQAPPPPPWDRLDRGRSVRVLTDDGIRHDGWIRRIAVDTMVLQLPYAPDEVINLPAIDSLWVRRSYIGPAAALGAFLVGVPSAIIGPQLACGDPGCDFTASDRVRFFFFGAIGGALVGGLLAGMIPGWEAFFP